MPKNAKPTSMRFSEEAVRLMQALAADLGCSQTAVVERALRELAEARGLRKPAASLEDEGAPQMPWNRWYAAARDKAKEYGLRRIPVDTYREQWLQGSSVQHGVNQIRLRLVPDAQRYGSPRRTR